MPSHSLWTISAVDYTSAKTRGPARIYSAELGALAPSGTNVLQLDGEIDFPQLTAGTISVDGQAIALRSATKGTFWWRAVGESVPDRLSIPVLDPPEEPNSEGITFATDNSGYFTISERSQPPLYFYRNTATLQIAREEATIIVRYIRGELEESVDLQTWVEVHAGGEEYRASGKDSMRFYRVLEQ